MKAFRGELLPQDPDDEPASLLLERIRAVRKGRAVPPDKPRERRRTKYVQFRLEASEGGTKALGKRESEGTLCQ